MPTKLSRPAIWINCLRGRRCRCESKVQGPRSKDGLSSMQWLAEICVHRPVFATVIVLFLTVVGGFSFFTLGVDRFPKIDLPTISVSTSNTGAAPQEMESEVTDIVEGALNTVPGIDEMRSNSSKGSSNITITFNLEKNP